MFSQEKLKNVLIKFLDRGCRDITRQELALELECSREDVVENEKIVEDILIELQEDRAIENCKKILKKLIAKGIEPKPESLADYLGVSVKEVKEKQYIFDQAVAEFREAQAVP
jgi:DNA-directed RNA polymerase sigma subunit (sigma70/sigma32)